MNLIEISQEYIDIVNNIMEIDEYLSVDEIDNILAPIKEKWDIKAQNIGNYLVKFEEEIESMKEQEKIIKERMREKISRLEKKYDSVKDYLKFNMIKSNIKSIKSPIIDIILRKNPPKTIIEDETIIPSDYIKQRIETHIDKIMIKNDINNGKIIPGAYLQESESLIIKRIV